MACWVPPASWMPNDVIGIFPGLFFLCSLYSDSSPFSVITSQPKPMITAPVTLGWSSHPSKVLLKTWYEFPPFDKAHPPAYVRGTIPSIFLSENSFTAESCVAIVPSSSCFAVETLAYTAIILFVFCTILGIWAVFHFNTWILWKILMAVLTIAMVFISNFVGIIIVFWNAR